MNSSPSPNTEDANADMICPEDLKGLTSDQGVVSPVHFGSDPEAFTSDQVSPDTIYVIEQIPDNNIDEGTANIECNYNENISLSNQINLDNVICNDVVVEILNETETEKEPSSTNNFIEIEVSSLPTEDPNLVRIENSGVSVQKEQSESISTQCTSSNQLKLHYDYLKNDSKNNDLLLQLPYKRTKVDIFTKDEGPKWHHVHGNVVTDTIVPEMVVKAFEHLPVYGRPNSKEELEEFQNNKIKEFVGCDLSEEDFEKLAKYCSPKHLETGKELKMSSSLPNPGVSLTDKLENDKTFEREDNELCIVKKCRMKCVNNAKNQAIMRLKYRSLRLRPFGLEDDFTADTEPENLLEPGKDLLYHIRLYRPFLFENSRGRTTVVSRTLAVPGRLPLWALRDRLLCSNDLDIRLDVSDNPCDTPNTCAKDLFPSGFMFINNVFYVDSREGCRDTSAQLRAWAAARRCVEFPKRDMNITLDEIRIKLGHPEVYIHQGNCEHLFTFSEMRLVNATDPLRLSSYPMLTGLSQNLTTYCTTCGEFSAKWIVTGCRRVPFDPAFFCDTCFRQYLYDSDNKKIDTFKAYSYMGNDMNVLKLV